MNDKLKLTIIDPPVIGRLDVTYHLIPNLSHIDGWKWFYNNCCIQLKSLNLSSSPINSTDFLNMAKYRLSKDDIDNSFVLHEQTYKYCLVESAVILQTEDSKIIEMLIHPEIFTAN